MADENLLNGEVKSAPQLKKELGLHNGIAIIVGIIIGSGIFISPTGVIKETGSIGMSLIVWTMCGLLSLIGAICYAELGTMIKKSGGDYVYIEKSFGKLFAFLYLWVAVIVIMPTGNAITALTFANYIIYPLFGGGQEPSINVIRLIAISCTLFLTFINCYNVKWGARMQDVFTVAKLLALITIIITGVVMLCKGHTKNLSIQNSFKGTNWDVGKIALSFYSGLFSYAGWNYLNFVVEELRNPFKNLPRSIYISLPMVTLVYVLANVAYFTVLDAEDLKNSPAVAITFAEKTLGSFSWIMPLFVACSTFGGLNGGIFASARLFFVGGRERQLPTFLAMINVKKYTPMPAILFIGITSCLMCLMTDVYILINYASFVESSFIFMSVLSLLWLRYKEPNINRPIKVNLFYPITFLLICLFLLVVPLYQSPRDCGMGLLITLTGIPIYFSTIYWKKRPQVINRSIDHVTVFLQKLLYSVPTKDYDE